MRTVVEHMGIYTYIDKSAGSACLTTQSCATSSLATRLSAKTAGDDVVGSADDRWQAKGLPRGGGRVCVDHIAGLLTPFFADK